MFSAYVIALILALTKFKEFAAALHGMGMPPWSGIALIAAFPLFGPNEMSEGGPGLMSELRRRRSTETGVRVDDLELHTYSANFVLPDGTITNLQRLMPGGITISTISNLGAFVTTSAGEPQVVNLSTGVGPVVLGSCAVMIPFSGPGFNPGTEPLPRGFGK